MTYLWRFKTRRIAMFFKFFKKKEKKCKMVLDVGWIFCNNTPPNGGEQKRRNDWLSPQKPINLQLEIVNSNYAQMALCGS